jgi:hypothetical protein
MKSLLSGLLAVGLAFGLTNGIAQNAKPPDPNAQAQTPGSKDCKGLTGNKLELCLKHGRAATDGQPNQGTGVRNQTQQTPDQGTQTGGSQNQRKTQ